MFVILISAQLQAIDLTKLRSFKCENDIQKPFFNESSGECTTTCGREGPFTVDVNGICIDKCESYTLSVGKASLCVNCPSEKPYFLTHLLECTTDCYVQEPIVDRHNVCLDECLGTSELKDNVTVCTQCVENPDMQFYENGQCVSSCQSQIHDVNGKCLTQCIGEKSGTLCTPCPASAPFFNGTCNEKCNESGNPGNLVDQNFQCIQSCDGVKVDFISSNNVPATRCIKCNQNYFYDFKKGECVSKCINNGSVCLDECFGTLNNTTQQCDKCGNYYDVEKKQCSDNCSNKTLEQNGYKLCVTQCPQQESGNTCTFCEAKTPFYDQGKNSCVESCDNNSYVDKYFKCVTTLPNDSFFIELLLEINDTTNVTYKKIIEKCPGNKTNDTSQQCQPCAYPTPFWDNSTNKCVARCQNSGNHENYVDINMICLDNCAGSRSSNYELYEGYNFTTCDRKCQTSLEYQNECQKCADTILDGKCVKNCNKSDNTNFIVDVNFQCLNSCESNLYYGNSVCMPKCVFFNGNGLNCLAYCDQQLRILSQSGLAICKTSDDQTCYQDASSEGGKSAFPSISNKGSCSGLKVNGVVMQGLKSCADYSKRGFLASEYVYEEDGSCVTKCKKYVINETMKCADSCSGYEYKSDKLYCLSSCSLYRIEEGKPKQCVDKCTESFPFISSRDPKLCVSKCDGGEKAVDGVCISSNATVNKGAIAGGVIGGLLLLALIILIVIIVLWKTGKLSSKCLDKIESSVQSKKGTNFIKSKTQWVV